MIAFITQKSHFLSVSLFLYSLLHLSFLFSIYFFALHLSASLTLASVFLTCAARHWRISKCAIYIKSRKLSPLPAPPGRLPLCHATVIRLGVNLLRNSHRIPWDDLSRRALRVFAVSRAASQQGDKFVRRFFLRFSSFLFFFFPRLPCFFTRFFSSLSFPLARTDRFCRQRDSHRRPIIPGRATANRKIILAKAPRRSGDSDRTG